MQRPLCCPWRCLWKRKRQKSSPGFLSATVPPSKKGSSSSTSSLTNDRRPETSERKEHTDDVSKAVADLKDVAQASHVRPTMSPIHDTKSGSLNVAILPPGVGCAPTAPAQKGYFRGGSMCACPERSRPPPGEEQKRRA